MAQRPRSIKEALKKGYQVKEIVITGGNNSVFLKPVFNGSGLFEELIYQVGYKYIKGMQDSGLHPNVPIKNQCHQEGMVTQNHV